MQLALYMDHHVPKAITNSLRARGVDVITAYEDGTDQFDDQHLLDRANELKRVLFTQDDDLLNEATKRMREGIPFYGMIYGHQLHVSIGGCVRDLETIAKAGEAEDIDRNICSYRCRRSSLLLSKDDFENHGIIVPIDFL